MKRAGKHYTKGEIVALKRAVDTFGFSEGIKIHAKKYGRSQHAVSLRCYEIGISKKLRKGTAPTKKLVKQTLWSRFIKMIWGDNETYKTSNR